MTLDWIKNNANMTSDQISNDLVPRKDYRLAIHLILDINMILTDIFDVKNPSVLFNIRTMCIDG